MFVRKDGVNHLREAERGGVTRSVLVFGYLQQYQFSFSDVSIMNSTSIINCAIPTQHSRTIKLELSTTLCPSKMNETSQISIRPATTDPDSKYVKSPFLSMQVN